MLAVLVLMAACLNVAGLFLARSVDRMREFGVRVALGAGRSRLVGQLTAEVAVFVAVAGAAALALAYELLRALSAWRLPLDISTAFDVGADGAVFTFAMVLLLLALALCTLPPLWRVLRSDPAILLHPPATSIGGRRLAMRDILLAMEVACCAVLLTGGVVSLRGLAGSLRTNLAMEPDRATVASFDLGLAGYDASRAEVFQRRALEAVAAIPGVEAAAYGNSVPLYVDQSTTTVFPEQVTASTRAVGSASYFDVSPAYFRALGTRLVRGREFGWSDGPASAQVAIVNEQFASRFGRSGELGWSFRTGLRGAPIRVVGIVEDGKYQALTEAPRMAVFYPILQKGNSSTFMIVRAPFDRTISPAEIRRVIGRLDPALPLYEVGTLRSALAWVFVPARAAAIALGAFAILAIMLMVTGIYGLAAYSVASRAREISIRMAIGAAPRQILRTVFGRVGAFVIAGSLAGIAAGLAGSRLLAAVVYQASAHDPVVLTAAVLAMLAVAASASWFPARRALATDPVRTLRED